MKNNSPTEAGQISSESNRSDSDTIRVDTINQVFALFKLNYHNQFYKAFSNATELNSIKRLWLETLKDYSPETMLLGAKSVVKSSEFLPTLKTMLQHCDEVGQHALPDVRSAYVEACCAASPKAEQNWSHPIVYFAGRQAGWNLLHSNSEDFAFPVFKQAFTDLSQKLRQGMTLELPEVKQLEKKTDKPASEETRKQYMDSLNLLFEEQDD